MYYGRTTRPRTRQVGRSTASRDVKRKARLPGRRVSSSRKVYYETRRNRTDRRGRRT